MSREESLGKRLLNYLGASADYDNGEIIVYFPKYTSPYMLCLSWHLSTWSANVEPLRSLMNSVKCALLHVRGFKTANPPFDFSSLDELDLQLSVRGF